MKMSSLLKTITVAGLAGTFALALVSTADAQRVKWKLHTAWGSSVPHIGVEAVRFADDIKALSGGTFILKHFEPGALVPANEGFDAVSKGAIEAAWGTAGYDVGKYPALAFFTAVPFGPTLGEYMGWIWYGGGKEIGQRVYNKHNIHPMHCMAIGPETSGWFRTEITSLEQLRGLKMRFFGLGARVMQKLGVSTQLLAGGDIFPALEKGVIDATEFSMPAMDIKYGFYQVAKNNYFPGWHQQVSIGILHVNMDKWKSLSAQNKKIMEVACRSSMLRSYVETEAVNPKAMVEMGTKYGVKTHRWKDEQLAVFEKAWMQVLEEDAKKDPLFKETADSYHAFRKMYAKWGEAQALKPTYLD